VIEKKVSKLAICFLAGFVVYAVIIPAYSAIVWMEFREVGFILLAAAILGAIAAGLPGFTELVVSHHRINWMTVLLGFRATWIFLAVLGLLVWIAFRIAQGG